MLLATCAPRTSEPLAPPSAGEPSSTASAPETAAPANDPPAARGESVARGGRLYDNWVSEKGLGKTFSADSPKTPALDGMGGPNSNGTLDDGSGNPLANTGHDYRLKNFFGWDLRGKAGIYGPAAQKKAFVLETDLLSDARTQAEILQWLEEGDPALPAFGAVLDETDLRDLAAFIVAVRTHAVPQPSDIFEVDANAPKNYRLLPGADIERGKQTFAARCAECHGSDGAKFPIDEVATVGTLSRTSGYEVWLKILNGHPGSPMGPQIRAEDGSGAEQGQLILDVLAALCDREVFVAGNAEDVPNGDLRCGAYLR